MRGANRRAGRGGEARRTLRGADHAGAMRGADEAMKFAFLEKERWTGNARRMCGSGRRWPKADSFPGSQIGTRGTQHFELVGPQGPYGVDLGCAECREIHGCEGDGNE